MIDDGQIDAAAEDRTDPCTPAEVGSVQVIRTQQRVREQINSFATPGKSWPDRISLDVIPTFVISSEVPFKREVRMEVVAECEAEAIRHAGQLEGNDVAARIRPAGNIPARIKPLISREHIRLRRSLLILRQRAART